MTDLQKALDEARSTIEHIRPDQPESIRGAFLALLAILRRLAESQPQPPIVEPTPPRPTHPIVEPDEPAPKPKPTPNRR